MKCHVNKPIIGRKSAGFTFCCFSHSDSLTFSTGYFSASIMWWKMFYIALWIQEAEGSAFGLSLFFIFLGVNFYVATSAFKNWNIRLLDIAHWQQEVVKFIFNLFGTSQLFCFVFKYIHAEGIRVWFWICCSSRYNLESIVADASHQAPWVNSYVYVGGIRLISIKYLYCWFKLEQLKYVTKETNKEWDEWVWKTMPVNYVVQSDIKHWSIRFIMYKRGEEAMIGRNKAKRHKKSPDRFSINLLFTDYCHTFCCVSRLLAHWLWFELMTLYQLLHILLKRDGDLTFLSRWLAFRCFGVVVCKPQKPLEHECIVFAEIEPLQPASAVINFIHRVIKNGKK